MLLLESELPITAVTVMVQKEAAVRLTAKPGTRESGAVTVAVNYYGEAETLFNVSRGSFMPAPKVDSAVIQIRPDCKYRNMVHNKELFFKVVRGAFSQRRKTMVNSLSSAARIPKDAIFSALEKAGLPETVRAEKLDMESLISFTNLLDCAL